MGFDWGVGLETELDLRNYFKVTLAQWIASENSQAQTLTEIQQIYPQSFLLIGLLLWFLKSVDSPGNGGFFMAFTGTLPKEGRKRKMLFEIWRFEDSKPRMMTGQEKRNLWISSITERKINKEIIFVILSGTDDCSLVICKIFSKKRMSF